MDRVEGSHDRHLADVPLALVVEHWRATDQDGWADTVAQHGWDAGCRHPDIAEAAMILRAVPGTAADLEAALAVIETALATANGSSAPGWTWLQARRTQLAGRLRRARSGRPTDEFDADCNPTYATPHHPVKARRQRPPRFARDSIDDRPR